MTEQLNRIYSDGDHCCDGALVPGVFFCNRADLAPSEDVPGLATEEDTMEDLIDKLKVLIPELLVANIYLLDGSEFNV